MTITRTGEGNKNRISKNSKNKVRVKDQKEDAQVEGGIEGGGAVVAGRGDGGGSGGRTQLSVIIILGWRGGHTEAGDKEETKEGERERAEEEGEGPDYILVLIGSANTAKKSNKNNRPKESPRKQKGTDAATGNEDSGGAQTDMSGV